MQGGCCAGHSRMQGPAAGAACSSHPKQPCREGHDERRRTRARLRQRCRSSGMMRPGAACLPCVHSVLTSMSSMSSMHGSNITLPDAVADNGRGLPDQQKVVVMHHRLVLEAVDVAPCTKPAGINRCCSQHTCAPCHAYTTTCHANCTIISPFAGASELLHWGIPYGQRLHYCWPAVAPPMHRCCQHHVYHFCKRCICKDTTIPSIRAERHVSVSR